MTRREVARDDGEVRWVQQDLTQPLDEASLPSSIDAIVHLAQSESYRDFPEGADDLFEVNVHSTQRLLGYARRAGAHRFVLASTGGVYSPGPVPVSEDASLTTPGPYFRSKRMAELLVEDYSELLNWAVLRFFFVYGPGPGQTLIPRLSEQILAGKEIVIAGNPGMRMNPIAAQDAAAAIEGALRADGSFVANVAGSEALTITDLVQRLGAALETKPRLRHTDAELAGDMVADTSRMRELLGVTPSIGLSEGLSITARSVAHG